MGRPRMKLTWQQVLRVEFSEAIGKATDVALGELVVLNEALAIADEWRDKVDEFMEEDDDNEEHDDEEDDEE